MFELIYTSVPKGLIPGRSGFSTVAMTEGMPPNLIVPLENLSGYNFTLRENKFLPALNPPCCYYIKMRYGNQQLHVAGRVAPNGLDYSRRNNKIAHHLLFESTEELDAISGRTAGLFLDPESFCREYTAEPAMLPFRKVPVCKQKGSLPARNWAELAGHAGFAAFTANRFQRSSDRPLHLIYPAGTPVEKLLGLVMEVSALLNSSLRNHLTFSTYFGSSSTTVDCFLRMVPDFSPLVSNLRRFHANDVIELGRENILPPVEEYSNLYEYACTGKLPESAEQKIAEPHSASEIRIHYNNALPPVLHQPVNRKEHSITVPPPPEAKTTAKKRKNSKKSYEKYLLCAFAFILTIIIGSLLIFTTYGKNNKQPANKGSVEISAAEPAVPVSKNKSAARAAAEKKTTQVIQGVEDKKSHREETASFKPEKKVQPEVPAQKLLPLKDFFNTPDLLKKSVKIPPNSDTLQFFAKIQTSTELKSFTVELPARLHGAASLYPVIQKIGTNYVDNKDFVEKGKTSAEVFVRSAVRGTVPATPVKGGITGISHLAISMSADKKSLIFTYVSISADHIMPKHKQIKKIYFLVENKVYEWENVFHDEYLKNIPHGKLSISEKGFPEYQDSIMEKMLKDTLISIKFGNQNYNTFLTSSLLFNDWNKVTAEYNKLQREYANLHMQLKKKTKSQRKSRTAKDIENTRQDILKLASDGDIKQCDKELKKYLTDFLNPNEKEIVKVDALNDFIEKIACDFQDKSFGEEKRSKINTYKNSWQKRVKEIAVFRILKKKTDQKSKEIFYCRNDMISTANKVLTPCRNIHPAIEKTVRTMMTQRGKTNWKTHPDQITAEEIKKLCGNICRHITYERVGNEQN